MPKKWTCEKSAEDQEGVPAGYDFSGVFRIGEGYEASVRSAVRHRGRSYREVV